MQLPVGFHTRNQILKVITEMDDGIPDEQERK